MDKEHLLEEIERLEKVLKKGTLYPNLTKMTLDNLKYKYNNPFIYKLRRKLREFLLWLSEKV